MKIRLLNSVATAWFAELWEIVDCAASLPMVGGRIGTLDLGIFLIRKMCATVSDDVSICRTR